MVINKENKNRILNLIWLLLITTNLSAQSINDLDRVSMWFSASQGVELQGDSSVLSWRDIRVAADSSFQVDTLKQPKLIAYDSLLNNQPIIYFDGVSDQLINLYDHDFAAMYIVSRWSGNETTFPTFNGLIARYADPTASFKHILIGNGGSSNIYTASTVPWLNSGIYVNNQLTRDYSPLNQFKMIYAQSDSSAHYNDLLIGSGIQANWYWKGGIAEIIGFDTIPSDSAKNIVNQYIQNKYAPPVNLGLDLVKNIFCDTLITAYKPWYTSYNWISGETDSAITVSQTGWYSVTVTDVFGFESTDSIYIEFPVINTISSDTICEGSSKIWTTNIDTVNFDFEWSNGTNDSLLNITEASDYWVKITDTLGCFRYSDTITISVDSFPTQTSLGMDKTVCQFGNLGLEVDNGGISYIWSTTDTTMQTVVDTAGSYWVEVRNDIGCVTRDTINITINGFAPTVGFNAINVCDNATTLFINTSFTTDGSNMIGWHWDFGNGDTSIAENSQYNYVSGVYDIVLQVETDSGCVNTIQQEVTIHQKPTAGFFPLNGLMCSNQESEFSNNSFSVDGVINAWNWDFGVVGTADTSSLENGMYVFSNAGSFNVQLISTTEYGCSDTTSQFISVKQSPTASYVLGDSCVNNLISFTNTSLGNLFSTNWDFGDANSSTLNSPSHIYNASGLFNTELIIRDLNGCYDTLDREISIYDTPVAHFIEDDFCVLNNSQLFDSSSTSSGTLNQWDWEVLTTSYNASIQHPSFSFSVADTGIYSVKLRVENSFGCTDSTVKVISVNPLPVPDFIFSPEIGLPPLMVNFTNNTVGGSSYEWYFGDSGYAVDESPSYTYLDSNNFEIKLIATSIYGCADSVIKTIQVIEPIVDVAVENIAYEFVSGTHFMKVIARVANKGVVAVQNLDLELSNSTTGSIIEKWTGNLLPNGVELIEFSSTIEMPRGEIPDVICVEALNPNSTTDVNSHFLLNCIHTP